MMKPIKHRYSRGMTLIEVLVTIVILAIGLLGVAGLQSRLQVSEVESYQRAQALILLDDMANRLASNRQDAKSYETATPMGAGMECPTGNASRQDVDSLEWCHALQGAGEKISENSVGALIGGRGCIEESPVGSGRFMITVAWQGLTPLAAPPSSVTCGADSYDTAGTACINDLCRRVVTTIVRFSTL